MIDESGSHLLTEIQNTELIGDGYDTLLLAEPLRSRRYFSYSGWGGPRAFWFWAAQIALFAISTVMLSVAMATRSANPMNCMEKLSAFCKLAEVAKYIRMATVTDTFALRFSAWPQIHRPKL